MPYADGRHHLDAGEYWKLSGTDDLLESLKDMAIDVPIMKLRSVLDDASEPMFKRMLETAPVGPTGRLKRDLTKGRIVYHERTGKLTITLGVHRGYAASRYAHLIEYGHGGPHPAPPHPFMRPAYDATVEQAYDIMREELRQIFSNWED